MILKINDFKINSTIGVLNSEKIIGVDTFFTSFNGLGGKLRTIPEDFGVNEVSKHPPEKENGNFVIADINVINWETNNLVRELSRRLNISRKRISFAGTKDKRAKSTRLMSFYNINNEVLSKIKIKDVEIDNIYRSDRPIKIGDLLGNRFEITIRNIKIVIKKELNELIKYLDFIGGFPNFYGIQRFGIIRPITHIVGKYIVNNDFKKAVMTYIANPIKGEDDEVYALRRNLEKTHDFSTALKSYPNKLNFEKAMLNKLVVNSEDYIVALKELPKNLLTMFTYAYQSYLFNKILSERIKRKLPINSAVEGDIILPIRKGKINGKIFVTDKNIGKVNKQISNGKAFVSGILFGSDSKYSKGEMGEIEHKIIDNEKINHRDFIIPDIPFISSSGSRRAILSPIKDLTYGLIEDDFNNGKNALCLKFELLKGCYATSLLREFMKADDIKNY